MEPAIVKIQKRANSLAVVLPRPLVHALGWRPGLYIEASLRGDILELAAVRYRRRARDGTMEETVRIDTEAKQV